MANLLTPWVSDREIPEYVVNGLGSILGHKTKVLVKNSYFDWAWGEHEPLVVLKYGNKIKKDTEERLAAPYTVPWEDGEVAVWARYMWGSAGKKGDFYGITRDLGRESGMLKNAEDAQRGGRAFVPNCPYGAGSGHLEGKIVQLDKDTDFAEWNGLPVGDGWGYMAQSTFDSIFNEEPMQKPGKTRDNFYLSQLLTWTPELVAEAGDWVKSIKESFRDPGRWRTGSTVALEDRMHFIEIEPRMKGHPSVTTALLRGEQDTAIRWATSLPFDTFSQIAGPTLGNCPTVEGKWIAESYPQQVEGNLCAIDLDVQARALRIRNRIIQLSDHDIEVLRQQQDLYANHAVAQYTMTSGPGQGREENLKGMFMIVPDAMLVDPVTGKQYDIVVSHKDFKMTGTGLALDTAKKREEFSFDGYVGFLNVYAPGVAVGVPVSIWKGMHRDYDGDYVFVVYCGGQIANDPLSWRPVAWQQVANLADEKTFKDDKSYTAIDGKQGDCRVKFMIHTLRMSVMIGAATTLRSTLYGISPDPAIRDWFCRNELNWKDGWRGMQEFIDRCVTRGTDFKNMASIDSAQKDLEILLQLLNRLKKLLGFTAPWASWERAGVFVHRLPQFKKNMTYEQLHDPDLIECEVIPETYARGTVYKILELALPAFEEQWKERVKSDHLNHFVTWALRPADEPQRQAALDFVRWFAEESKSINWSATGEITSFYATAQEKADEFARIWFGGDRWMAQNAIWWAAHQQDNQKSGGMVALIAFPDQRDRLILEKPGQHVIRTLGAHAVLTGLNYAFTFSDERMAHWETDIVVVRKPWTQGGKLKDSFGKQFNRSYATVPGGVPGLKPMNSQDFPEFCVGTFSIESQCVEPDEGTYHAIISRRVNDKGKVLMMWDVHLTKLS